MSAVRPAPGLFEDPRPLRELADLYANLWQLCYVTRDLDRGMALMRERFGLEHCVEVPTEGATFLKGDEPAGWNVRVAMGSRGSHIIELIEPISGEVDFYRRAIPAEGEMGFHHMASFIPVGDEPWERLLELLAAQGKRIDYTVLIPNRVRAGYVDTTAELGHYLEVCQLQPDDIELFSGLVRDSA